MLRRFIFTGNRSHARISSSVSAFVYSGMRKAMASQCLSESPDSGDWARGEQGNLDSSEQEGLSYFCCCCSDSGANIIDYPTVIASTAQRGQQSCILYQEKMECTVSQSQEVGAQSQKIKHCHCLCFMHILAQPLFLWHVRAGAAQLMLGLSRDTSTAQTHPSL